MGGGFEYGTAGPTHYGIEDVGVMRLLQQMAVVAPADAAQVTTVVAGLRNGGGRRISVSARTIDCRSRASTAVSSWAESRRSAEGSDIVLFSMGGIAPLRGEAADRLLSEGVSATVVVVSSIYPCPVDDIRLLHFASPGCDR